MSVIVFEMPKSRKTHESCRKDTCLLCFKRAKHGRQITPDQYKIISTYIIDGLTVDDKRLPCVLCTTCRLIVADYGKGVFNRIIDLFDLSSVVNTPETRSDQSKTDKCCCTLCKISCSNFGSLTLKKALEGPHLLT